MKLTNKEQFKLKFILGHSLFLGGGISLLLAHGDKDAYLAIILGFLLGIPLIYCYSKISFKENIKKYLQKNNWLNILCKIIYLIYLLFITFYLITVFGIFIYSFYLPFTNTIISCTPFLFLAIYLSTKNMKSISRIGQILFFINIILLTLKFTMLAGSINFNNFLPIYTIPFKNLGLTSLIFAIFITSPYLLLIDEKCDFKTNLKAYSANSFLISLILVYLIGTFGSTLARTFSYPEFSILRQIDLFNFIQNIESFLALNWLFDLFLAFTLSCKKIKETIGYQKNIFTFLIGFILIYLVDKFIIGNYIEAISIYHLSFPIFFILTVIIYLLFALKKRFSPNN